MEGNRMFLIVMDNTHKVRVVASSKWQALDIAVSHYPQYYTFQYCNTVRKNPTFKNYAERYWSRSPKANEIIQKF